MFKTRKIIQLSQHSTTTRTVDASKPKYGINPLRKQLKLNQYAIHAKSIIQQLNEQHQLGVLKNQMIWNKNKQVLELLSKCTNEVRCQLFIKLIGFYAKIKAKFSKQSFDKFDQILAYITAICERNQKKFCQLILLQRIDEILIYIFKTFPENRDDVIKKVRPIIRKMENIKQKIQQILPKQDYKLFTICLSSWKLQTKQIKKQQTWDNFGRASVATVNSIVNEKQNQAEERLRNFDKAIQTQQFKKHLQSLMKKKKKTYTRSSSIRQVSCKRISTTWGKQESQNSINNTEIIKKGQAGMGCSKFNSSAYAPRKSISTFKKEDSSTDKISQVEAKRVSISYFKGFQPFYFFVIIKGNIRIITVQKAQIIEQTNKLKVHLSGYFCYPLIFHKFHNIFKEQIQSQTLKKFILAKSHLKQNKMWKILAPKKKIQKDNIENEHKNLICQLLQQNQKFNFNEFYKKYNVYFFTTYQSQNKKSKQGTLIVYDNVFEDKLETIPITNWKFRQSIELAEDISQQQKVYSYENKRILISDNKLREETEKIKILKLNRAKNKFPSFYQRSNQKNHNCLLLTIKNQGKFVVLTQNITKNKISVSNLNSEFRYQSLFSVNSPNRREISRSIFSVDLQNRERDKLLYKLVRRREYSTRTILNRRVGKPQHIQIRYQLCFLKKVKDLGFAMCRLFILKPDQGQIILSQVYLSQNQKYYVFAIKPTTICNIALFDINNISNQVLHDRLTYLIKKIEIIKISGQRTQSGQFGLALQLGESLNLEGSQLFYRECISDQKLNPLFIDSLFLSKSQITNKQHASFELSRQVYQLGKKLHNYKSETLKVQDYNIVKKYIKYCQFLKCLKEYTKSLLKSPSQLFHKNKNQYYYLCKSKKKKNQKILKLKISSNQWEFVQFAGQDVSKIKIKDWGQKYIMQKLNRKELNIYLKRLVKDPLLYKLKINSLQRI